MTVTVVADPVGDGDHVFQEPEPAWYSTRVLVGVALFVQDRATVEVVTVPVDSPVGAGTDAVAVVADAVPDGADVPAAEMVDTRKL